MIQSSSVAETETEKIEQKILEKLVSTNMNKRDRARLAREINAFAQILIAQYHLRSRIRSHD